MPIAEKYDSRVRRGCSKGASKLRSKSSTDAERSEGAAEILFCRGYRPRAGGLFLTKQGRPRKPTAKKATKRKAVKNGRSGKSLNGFEAIKRDKHFSVEIENDGDDYCVFGDVTGFCYGTYSDESAANARASAMNAAKKAGERRSVKNGVSHTYGESVSDFRRGTRVELHPGTDRWSAGDRYGDVTTLSQKKGLVRVKLDRSGDSLWFSPKRLRIEEY